MLRRWAVTAVVCGAVAGMLGAAGPVERPRAGADSVVVIQEDPDPVLPGEVTTVHGIVANETQRDAPELVVRISLPAEAVPEGRFYPKSCRKSDDDRTVTCTFPAGLPPERTATALIPVRVSRDVVGSAISGTVSVSSSTDPGVDDSQPFTIQVTG
ncbi:hypothetical protein AB0C76_29835 [Kitasatospora sp. NPDC048722]|uniref:hypothetical protein n=1 Tax=Kitasatospora sp. NPDC048722 TaxID=3155639 RepID=UPI0033D1BA1B